MLAFEIKIQYSFHLLFGKVDDFLFLFWCWFARRYPFNSSLIFIFVQKNLEKSVAGSAKFGILFKKVPIRLAVDITPKVGLYAYNGGIHFWGTGIFNGGLSATYCF